MKIPKCGKCGARFLRIDGMTFNSDKGELTQFTVCPKCGHTVGTKWVLTNLEKVCLGIVVGLLFEKAKPVAFRNGAAIMKPDKEATHEK